MTTENYLQIQSGVVTNMVFWDGNNQTWTPPINATMLKQLLIPAKVWILNIDKTDWILSEIIGAGGIGFTWDGAVLTTNEAKPVL